MLILIGELNGQKIEIPVTADTGTGAPVGSLISMYKKSSPSGYLYCDGSTFDATKYPALYQYLGSNVLPDYRECVAVGAEQNTTDSIQTHDVYTEGQFKDDQVQEHSHKINWNDTGSGYGVDASQNWNGEAEANIVGGINIGRKGGTTHGKQKAVFIYIKATSGLTENQQENVLNTINENLSYSTTEHKTGKKWIDGKDIYSVTFSIGNLPNNTAKVISFSIPNLNDITKIEGIANSINITLPIPYMSPDNTERISVYAAKQWGNITVNTINDMSTYYGCITLEYTKTTDN